MEDKTQKFLKVDIHYQSTLFTSASTVVTVRRTYEIVSTRWDHDFKNKMLKYNYGYSFN